MESAPPELVRKWCDHVRTMGPDELDAIEALTHKHWERASLRELRGAIERRRRQLGMGATTRKTPALAPHRPRRSHSG